MNFLEKNIMKTTISTIANVMVVFALVVVSVSAVSTATATVAEASSYCEEGQLNFSPCLPKPTLTIPVVEIKTCDITASAEVVGFGSSVTLNWEVTGFTNVKINGETVSNTSGSKVYTNITERTVFELRATDGQGSNCVARVIVDCELPQPDPVCTLTPETQTIDRGGRATLNWTTENASNVTLTGFGSVNEDGSVTTEPLFSNTTYTLRAIQSDGLTVSPNIPKSVTCVANVVVEQPEPLPTCDSFTASPSNIVVGSSATLNWTTSNATQVAINNGIGNVSLNGSQLVTPLADTTYVMTVFGTNGNQDTCSVPVTVSSDPVPVCEFFTATPDAFGVGGGTTLLSWSVTDASIVNITPNIGDVNLVDSQNVNVTESITYTLTATDTDGDEVSCLAPITVADPEPLFTCADNVTFEATDNSIRRGQNTTLNWSTVDVDSVSISVINSTDLNGRETISPSSDTTYTLTATQGDETINCPVSIDVDSGGGGGSSSPRCDLDISDSKIKLGDEITLSWDTSNAREVILKDDEGEILFTTEDYLSDEKEDYYDGSIDLTPERDTKYTLTAERGSSDRDCSVEVEVEDSVVVLQTRDQQPLVAGISLSQVPYTGFEAGPVMTVLFYMLLVAWALYITYLIVLRKQSAGTEDSPIMDAPALMDTNHEIMKRAEESRPDAFVSSVAVDTTPKTVPNNLPIADKVIGYDSIMSQFNESLATELENRAHTQKALLSSDAVNYFISTTEGTIERNDALDEVIMEAKKNYPLEDGWIVINEDRMRNLCDECLSNENQGEPEKSDTLPNKGQSSLAEAIVTGSVSAAYEMIGTRPMLALADAASDLDSIYRIRKGESVSVSNLLITETANLSEDQIKNMITALTGALDGTYTDEASAVKVAIMKAVKEVA